MSSKKKVSPLFGVSPKADSSRLLCLLSLLFSACVCSLSLTLSLSLSLREAEGKRFQIIVATLYTHAAYSALRKNLVKVEMKAPFIHTGIFLTLVHLLCCI